MPTTILAEDILERAPAILYVARPDGTIAYVNAAWTRFSGLPVEHVLEHGWIDVVHADDARGVTDAWFGALAAETPFFAEFRVRDRHGDVRWVTSRAIPSRDERGAVDAWYGSLVPFDQRRDTDQALMSLADAIPQLVWANDAAGNAVLVNRRWIEYTGLSFEASLGHGWMSVLHPDDVAEVQALWSDALVTGMFSGQRPYRIRRHDGVYRWFMVLAVAVRDQSGTIVRWYGTNTDVDDQYRAVQRRTTLDRLGASFAESLEFEQAARSVVSALCEDVADFAFVDVLDGEGRLRRAAVETGRLNEDAEAFKRFAPPPEAEHHPINVALRSGRPQIVANVDTAWLRRTTWSDEHFAFESRLPIASIAYLPMIAAGERVGVLTFGAVAGTGRGFSPVDLADAEEVARRAAIALANARLYADLVASESRYRRIIDTAQEGVWIFDRDQRTRYVNARVTEMLGYEPDEMYGRALREFVVPHDRHLANEALARHRDGKGHRDELRLVHRSGRIVCTTAASNPLLDAAGAYAGALGMFTDITDRKATEQRYRVIARASEVLSATLDIGMLLGRFADLLVAELADEVTIAVRPDRAVVRRRAALPPDAPSERVPLRHRNVEMGSVTMRTRTPAGPDDLALFEELVARASIAIENAQLYEREHRVAMTLQRAMLPAVLPDVDGLAFDAVYYPGATEAEIGGDWYDALQIPDGRVVLSIGDVTGRGLTAAVIMGRMRQAIETLATYESDPVRLLDAADAVLRRAHPDAIVTALVGVLDPMTRTLQYATAGHPTPLVRTIDGELFALPGRGLPLGLRDGRPAPQTSTTLPPGALLVFYTDGLVEATRDINEGERRVNAALSDEALATARAPAAALVARVLDDKGRDDVAILTVRLAKGAAAERGWTVGWRFDAREPVSARDARQALSDALRGRESDVDLHAAQLVFGELIGNAARHTSGVVEVELTWRDDGAVVLSVTDDGPGFDAEPVLPPADAESGRGLFLVSQLTAAFGVSPCGERTRAHAVLLRVAAEQPSGSRQSGTLTSMDNEKVVTTKETTVEQHVEQPTVVEKRTVVEERPQPKPHETVTIETHTEG